MALPIGGFMPIPLAMMIPFMATQSLVMGDAFGKAYQFGKRKISAMSNDEFNKLTLTDLISEMQTDFKLAIPKIEQSIQDSTELQSRIISEMLRILPQFVTSDANTQLGQDISKTFGTQLTPEGGGFNLGGLQKFIDGLGDVFLPKAYGATTPPPQTFTQEQQNLQDNPPSNIPFTLQGMTRKQIEDAYSDMLSGRITLTTKQRQELTLAFKSATFEKTPTETFTAIPDPTPQASLIYHLRKMDLLSQIVDQERLRAQQMVLYNSSNSQNRSAILKLAEGYRDAKVRLQKTLQNHITQARNVIVTKSEANNDWNKRIWNVS